jgi:hypothetical protein
MSRYSSVQLSNGVESIFSLSEQDANRIIWYDQWIEELLDRL